MLNDNLAKFVGQIEQYNPPFIWKENLLIPKVEKVEKANLMAKTSKKNDKRVAVPRIRQCHSIELLAFQPPNFKMKVVSDGLFSCRALVNDLGGQLNSCAHLTQLHLNKMGVITEDICLKKYELHFTYIRDAVQKYSNLFKNDLKKYQDLKTLRRGVV